MCNFIPLFPHYLSYNKFLLTGLAIQSPLFEPFCFNLIGQITSNVISAPLTARHSSLPILHNLILLTSFGREQMRPNRGWRYFCYKRKLYFNLFEYSLHLYNFSFKLFIYILLIIFYLKIHPQFNYSYFILLYVNGIYLNYLTFMAFYCNNCGHYSFTVLSIIFGANIHSPFAFQNRFLIG